MKAEIEKDYGELETYEISVNWNGYNFIVIYGTYFEGRAAQRWFVVVPNWIIGMEIAEPSERFYNASKLSEAFKDSNKGNAIAMAIKEHYEARHK